MKEKVLEIISRVTKISIGELLIKEAEEKLWDSLIHVELVITLESEFGLFFEPEEIAEMVSVKKILELVERKAE